MGWHRHQTRRHLGGVVRAGNPVLAHRLILKDPDERFQTAEEVFEALTE